MFDVELLVNIEQFNFVDLGLQRIYLIYMYKPDLALNNLEWLICHKTETTVLFSALES